MNQEQVLVAIKQFGKILKHELPRGFSKHESGEESVIYKDQAHFIQALTELGNEVRLVFVPNTTNDFSSFLKKLNFQVLTFYQEADSLELLAAEVNYTIAKNQNNRWQILYKEGLESLTELQEREQLLQQATASREASENNFLVTKAALNNARMELNRVQASYLQDISSTESSLNSTLAGMHDAERYFAQLCNQYANIRIRNQQYYMLAPQDGFVVRALFAGIGETISQGEGVVTIMPENPDKAVELYVRPMDVPLLSVGRKVRLEFDGWPTLQFSGWPNAAVGTFGGVIKVIDYVETPSQGGRYRILAVPDQESDGDWPDQLRLGSGVQGFALLEEVPVWYEPWRLYYGFPPSLQDSMEQTSYQNR